MAQPSAVRIGLIADTHGLLRAEAVAFLRGCDHIVHAGDIGSPAILHSLAELAPVVAVRGNNDQAPWARTLRECERLSVGSSVICVIHDLARLDLDVESSGVDVVISGHSHKPSLERRGSILFINPGSAGPRRFNLPIAVGELCVGVPPLRAYSQFDLRTSARQPVGNRRQIGGIGGFNPLIWLKLAPP